MLVWLFMCVAYIRGRRRYCRLRHSPFSTTNSCSVTLCSGKKLWFYSHSISTAHLCVTSKQTCDGGASLTSDVMWPASNRLTWLVWRLLTAYKNNRVCESRINTELLESDHKIELGSFYGQMFNIPLDRTTCGTEWSHGYHEDTLTLVSKLVYFSLVTHGDTFLSMVYWSNYPEVKAAKLLSFRLTIKQSETKWSNIPHHMIRRLVTWPRSRVASSFTLWWLCGHKFWYNVDH